MTATNDQLEALQDEHDEDISSLKKRVQQLEAQQALIVLSLRDMLVREVLGRNKDAGKQTITVPKRKTKMKAKK